MTVYLKTIELAITNHPAEFIVILRSLVNSLSLCDFFLSDFSRNFMLSVITYIYPFTYKLTYNSGVEKFPENFALYFGAFVESLNPHSRSLPFLKSFLKKPR